MLQATDRQGRYNHEARPRAKGRPQLRRWAVLLAAAATLAAFPAAASAGTGGLAGPTSENSTDASTSSEAPAASEEFAFGAIRTGGATWYGPGFYGRRTACGQVLRPSTIGVAHRNLPCGTAVRFTYRGRYIVTTVIDRGPFTRGNVWDLTNGARMALGFEGADRLHYSIALGATRPH
jgi:rare lipoprotein A (peptidoglycan hydrolase)